MAGTATDVTSRSTGLRAEAELGLRAEDGDAPTIPCTSRLGSVLRAIWLTFVSSAMALHSAKLSGNHG